MGSSDVFNITINSGTLLLSNYHWVKQGTSILFGSVFSSVKWEQYEPGGVECSIYKPEAQYKNHGNETCHGRHPLPKGKLVSHLEDTDPVIKVSKEPRQACRPNYPETVLDGGSLRTLAASSCSVL